MSTAIAKNFQVGADGTATNNFTIRQPATPDGTVRIANGNTGSTTDLVTLTSAGNLGLGVTPSAWSGRGKAIDISKAGSFYGDGMDAYWYAGVSQNAYYNAGWKYRYTAPAARYEMDANSHVWYTAPSGTAGNAISFTQAMTLDASGNLGVGTTSPSSRITVKADGSSGAALIMQNSSGTQATRIGPEAAGTNTDTGIYSGGYTRFYVNGNTSTPAGMFDSSGNLLVGTTSVIGSSTTQYTGTSQAVVAGYASNASFTNGVVLARMAGTSTSAQLFIGQNNNSSAVFYARGDGAIFSTSTSITAVSDQTLKTNVRDLDTGLSEVLALKPRRFDWLEGEGQNTKNVAGFVAQEVEQVLPELVDDYIYKVDEENGNVIKKSLKMGDMLPTLVKAIQEQQTLIQDQLAIITALTARVEALEAAKV